MEYRWNRERGADGLRHQDRAVLNLLLAGKRREDISRELAMPLGTVNMCCTRLYKQLECANVQELIIKCRDG